MHINEYLTKMPAIIPVDNTCRLRGCSPRRAARVGRADRPGRPLRADRECRAGRADRARRPGRAGADPESDPEHPSRLQHTVITRSGRFSETSLSMLCCGGAMVP